jgi:hypothetical protein
MEIMNRAMKENVEAFAKSTGEAAESEKGRKKG